MLNRKVSDPMSKGFVLQKLECSAVAAQVVSQVSYSDACLRSSSITALRVNSIPAQSSLHSAAPGLLWLSPCSISLFLPQALACAKQSLLYLTLPPSISRLRQVLSLRLYSSSLSLSRPHTPHLIYCMNVKDIHCTPHEMHWLSMIR